MTRILLIDYTRSFLDGRKALIARTAKSAVQMLVANDGKLDEIWFDSRLGPADNAKPILDYLALRAKIGSKYPVKAIMVHTLDEGQWQLLNAKLTNQGYNVIRTSIRETLG